MRYKNEEDIRMKLADLNAVKGKINSVKFNIKKKELRLDKINYPHTSTSSFLYFISGALETLSSQSILLI